MVSGKKSKIGARMDGTSVFLKDYFIQTRKEIDVEKGERDNLLNFIVLLVGGIAYAASQVAHICGSQWSVNEPRIFLLMLLVWNSLLLLFWSLMAVRADKLRQIAQRWYCLFHLLDQVGVDEGFKEYALERMVSKEFTKANSSWWRFSGVWRAYFRKDVRLALAFCVLLSACPLWFACSGQGLHPLKRVIIFTIFVPWLVWNYYSLQKPEPDPFPIKEVVPPLVET